MTLGTLYVECGERLGIGEVTSKAGRGAPSLEEFRHLLQFLGGDSKLAERVLELFP
jgi:hypothetical protein